MFNRLIIILGRCACFISRSLNIGNGSTWPGHLALKLNKNFIKQTLSSTKIKIILVAGTNGKTTTSGLITHILKQKGHRIFQNYSGANLLNGIASALILSNSSGFAVFEIDENTLPLILLQLTPYFIVLLNLFRDQLDRYGEINLIAQKWQKAFEKLSSATTIVACADDPQFPHILQKTLAKVYYFGINDQNLALKTPEHASDSIFCPKCANILTFTKTYLSHLGDWYCPKCEYKRPDLNLSSFSYYPLSGTYSRYDTLAAVLLVKLMGISEDEITLSLKTFKPVFGRQEQLMIRGKNVAIFLSKNPASFNASLSTITQHKAKKILIVLNDRIPDGLDVSWIWDINMENYTKQFDRIFISGDRAYDMALRLKYADFKNFEIHELLANALKKSLSALDKNEILYILPTYSAMLSVRKLLLGKSIL